MPDLNKLQNLLGLKLQDEKLLELALTHKSYAAENGQGRLGHNERLEFLGDAVLELVVSQHLYNKFPAEPEGRLTHWRSVLVNTQSLAQVARQIRLDKFLRLSRGEARSQGAQKDSILAGALEALIGAIYLDQGFKAAERFIAKHLLTKLPRMLAIEPAHNPKGFFQEKAQEITGITPVYQVLSESGPDHAKEFRVGLYLGEEKVAEGKGKSKQEAETDAARRALKEKGW